MIDNPKPDLTTVRTIVEQIAKGLRRRERGTRWGPLLPTWQLAASLMATANSFQGGGAIDATWHDQATQTLGPFFWRSARPV